MQQVSVSVYLPTTGSNIKVLDPQAVETEFMALYNNVYNVQREIQSLKDSLIDFQEFVSRNYPDVAKDYFIVRAAQGRIK